MKDFDRSPIDLHPFLFVVSGLFYSISLENGQKVLPGGGGAGGPSDPLSNPYVRPTHTRAKKATSKRPEIAAESRLVTDFGSSDNYMGGKCCFHLQTNKLREQISS